MAGGGKWELAIVAALLLGWTSTATLADTVIVEAESGGQNHGVYSEAGSTGWNHASTHSSAPGLTAGIGSRVNGGPSTPGSAPFFTLDLSGATSPLANATSGSQYNVYYTFTNSNANTSSDIVVKIDQTHCTGLPATTTIFQRGSTATSPAFGQIGTITLDGTGQPIIKFTFNSGTALNSTGFRFVTDAFKFDAVDPCHSIPDVTGVNGPVYVGEATVDVAGCATSGLQAVTVYQNGIQVGQLSSGFTNTGTETVPVTGLTKGSHLQATQKLNNHEGCAPGATIGPVVGGGSNPHLGVAFGLRENATQTGPIGAPGDTTSPNLFWIKATGQISAAGGAVAGGVVLAPGKCWQSVSATPGVDPVYRWTGVGTLDGTFASLDALQLSIEDSDTGPYEIYLDEVYNGSTKLYGWEDSVVEMAQPSSSSTTIQYLLLAGNADLLNLCAISTGQFDRDGHSLRARWQFISAANNTQAVRLLFHGDSGGVNSPQVDLSKPLSVRVLLLPVGVTPGTPPVIDTPPANQFVAIGSAATFNVTAHGTGTLHYHWLKNGVEVGSDSPSYTTAPLAQSDIGSLVSVSVCDDNGSVHSDYATLTASVCHVPSVDFNGDSDVDLDDFAVFQRCYNPGVAVGTPGSPTDCGCADTNHDGFVNGNDLGTLNSPAAGTFRFCQSRSGVKSVCAP